MKPSYFDYLTDWIEMRWLFADSDLRPTGGDCSAPEIGYLRESMVVAGFLRSELLDEWCFRCPVDQRSDLTAERRKFKFLL